MIRRLLQITALIVVIAVGGNAASAPVSAEESTLESHLFYRFQELDAFFADRYAQLGQPYASPALVVLYPESSGGDGCYVVDSLIFQCVGSVDTGSERCGVVESGKWKSHYCADSFTIYLTIEDIDYEWSEYGDFAVSFTIAHEWGHHLQNLYYEDFWPNTYGKDRHFFEVQADCLAGVYTAEVSIRGGLEYGDVEEALDLNYHDLGDNRSKEEGQSHGSSEERVEAFWYGYQTGGCDDYQ